MAESEEELKNLWKRVKEESEKVGLQLNIQKPRFSIQFPSSSITSPQIAGEKMQAVTEFLCFISKIFVDND